MSADRVAKKETEQRRFMDMAVAEVEPSADAKDALRKAAITELFRPHKTFRDAIHHDIMLTTLEVDLVNTAAFQRLRRIKQLGATSLVYPSAVHTRFEHSIGTLAAAVRLIGLIERNPVPDPETATEISDRDRLIIRLCALLHDLSHVPYGHSLEDEGRLLDSQWKDSRRVDLLLGPVSEVSKAIHANGKLLEAAKHDPSFDPDTVLAEVKASLVAIETHHPESLSRPYIADIVGNTVCADLLDYIVRDMTFLGLQERPDDRFLSYLYLKKHLGKVRVVLRLSKGKAGEVRRDVQSEFVQLLRLRYSLAEKALYHHAKIAATSMIMSAVADNIVNGAGFGYRESLYAFGDDELVRDLIDHGTPPAQTLARAFRERRLYKPFFTTKRSKLGEDDFPGKNQWVQWFSGKGLRSDLSSEEAPASGIECAGNRVKFERALESILRVKAGDISLYCPPPRIGAKLAETLVEVQAEVGYAYKCLTPIPRKEVRSIRKKHEDLWTLAIFGNPETINREKAAVGQAEVTKLFRCLNSIDFSDMVVRGYLDLYEDACVSKSGGERLREEQIVAIEQAATRGGPADFLISLDKEHFHWLSFEAYERRRASVLAS